MPRGRSLRRAASLLLSATVSLASAALMLLLALALITGFFVPLLSDEVSTHLGNARLFEEHGTVMTLLPQCTSTWVQRVPVTLYPGGVLLTLAYENVGLVGLKISGIVGAILGMAGVVWLACRGLKTRTETAPTRRPDWCDLEPGSGPVHRDLLAQRAADEALPRRLLRPRGGRPAAPAKDSAGSS